jgi:hypothetical protein
MDLYVLSASAVSAVVGFGFGFALASAGMKALFKEAKHEIFRLKNNVAEAEKRYLETHRRELAQIIIGVDSSAFKQAFFKGEKFESEMKQALPERIVAELAALSHKYPYYAEFELLGSRHFVSYDDGISMIALDDVIDRYLDISKWLILLLAKEKSVFKVYDKQEVEVYLKDARRRTDTAFKKRIEQAMDLYNRVGRALYKRTDDFHLFTPYEDDELLIVHVHSATPDTQYGIYFKDTDEHAVYSTWCDGESDKTYRSFYRSDRLFKEHKLLLT